MAKSNNTNTKLQSSNKNKGSAAEAEEVTVARPETEAESRRAGKEEERDDEGDVTISEIVNGTLEKRKKKKKKERSEKGDKGCDCKFPMNRIRRIIKSEGSAVHIAQDSVFLINKALEKFLELFCKEAYACATLDKKKHVEYKHLSSVVGKRKRFDFLSDFVPEKVKARDALAEMSSAET